VTETTIRAAPAGAVADVLESMFFREAPAETTEVTPEEDTVTVYVKFDGDPPGCFQMRLTQAAANAIAADFLGEDIESISARQSTDVTLELGNMICGAVLSRIESSASFRLGAPRVLADEIVETAARESTRYTVETGSGPMTVAIQMETRTCPQTEKYAY
jgi:CheY-specific phosphatase CheX